MHPELFGIPFTHLTIKSYGLMMVIGFICAVWLIRRLSRDITPDPQLITNAALYSLIAGILGARVFYVVHHFEQFEGRLSSVFAIWQGGLELLGGVLLAIVVIFWFLLYHKLPIRRYLDALAIGLMIALAFGRIGCFLNGCCFGKPAHLPWAVRFPYGSLPYRSQAETDPLRNRSEPYFQLPSGFFNQYYTIDSALKVLKQYAELTSEQKDLLKKEDKYKSLPVHPTQLYSSMCALLSCFLLFLFLRRAENAEKLQKNAKIFAKPGCTFALMFILYAPVRFFMEYLRDDNPFEYGWWIIYKGGTISQNLAIYMVILGIVLMIVFQAARADGIRVKSATPAKSRA